jgi:hypothetical protein
VTTVTSIDSDGGGSEEVQVTSPLPVKPRSSSALDTDTPRHAKPIPKKQKKEYTHAVIKAVRVVVKKNPGNPENPGQKTLEYKTLEIDDMVRMIGSGALIEHGGRKFMKVEWEERGEVHQVACPLDSLEALHQQPPVVSPPVVLPWDSQSQPSQKGSQIAE